MNGKVDPNHPGGKWQCKCSECHAYRIEYRRNYRSNNREFVNGLLRSWHKAHPEKHREYNSRHGPAYRAKNKERSKEWYRRHKDKPSFQEKRRVAHRKRMSTVDKTAIANRAREWKRKASRDQKDKFADRESRRLFRNANPGCTASQVAAHLEALRRRRWLRRAKRALKDVEQAIKNKTDERPNDRGQ